MFLLNSRSPLVTATSLSLSWHSFSRSYRAILPSSFTILCPSHLRLLTLGTCVSSWYDHFYGFSWDLGLIRLCSRLLNLLTMTVLRLIITLRRPMTETYELAQAVTIIVEGHTNINAFPFRSFRLRMTLGPANPRLINSAEEPWFIRRCGFSPHCAATLPKTLICIRSSGP